MLQHATEPQAPQFARQRSCQCVAVQATSAAGLEGALRNAMEAVEQLRQLAAGQLCNVAANEWVQQQLRGLLDSVMALAASLP
jgi:hypothetical protein